MLLSLVIGEIPIQINFSDMIKLYYVVSLHNLLNVKVDLIRKVGKHHGQWIQFQRSSVCTLPLSFASQVYYWTSTLYRVVCSCWEWQCRM